ncbi:MAG TPA: succinate dehydrogenase/fumarate reductase iron-sulfur subunit [Vicinamibacterales bacterium]|nr:succinate dehydrogenase/fumarate reductase iron-sulfur subunit [Vicinamibacterales bacterium]
MTIHLRVWRQAGPDAPGRFEIHTAETVSPDMSFLEMLDVVNEQLIRKHVEPIAFDSDCREGICGTCGFLVNGRPHGPEPCTTVCQLHMRAFRDGDTITLEPWRAAAFPVIKDLVVDRSAFDRIIQAGGYTSANVGGAPDGNALPIPKPAAEAAFDAAQCIGCGACVAACKNASAALFTSAKVAHLAHLPQGQVERQARVLNMVSRMDREGFGSCSNEGECEAVCPKGISLTSIATMNREFWRALLGS